jgi:hypothetical protein
MGFLSFPWFYRRVALQIDSVSEKRIFSFFSLLRFSSICTSFNKEFKARSSFTAGSRFLTEY